MKNWKFSLKKKTILKIMLQCITCISVAEWCNVIKIKKLKLKKKENFEFWLVAWLAENWVGPDWDGNEWMNHCSYYRHVMVPRPAHCGLQLSHVTLSTNLLCLGLSFFSFSIWWAWLILLHWFFLLRPSYYFELLLRFI